MFPKTGEDIVCIGAIGECHIAPSGSQLLNDLAVLIVNLLDRGIRLVKDSLIYITEGIMKSNLHWMIHGDISAEELIDDQMRFIAKDRLYSQ